MGTGAARGPGPRGIDRPEPTGRTGGPSLPPARSPFHERPKSEDGRSRAARIARRDSRTAARDRDGAATTTRCPRAASPAETRSMNSLTSCVSPQGCGLTWAIASGSGGTGVSIEARRGGQEKGPPLDGPLPEPKSGGRLLARGRIRRELLRALARCLATMLGDELLSLLPRLVVGPLGVRGLHQVA